VNEVIPDALDGERIDRVLSMVADVSRSTAAVAIAGEQVSLDGSVVTARSTRVRADQTLTFPSDLGAVVASLEPDPDVDVEVLHVDEHVIVVNKTPGQVVHPGAGNTTGTVAQGLLARYPDIADVGDPMRPGIVHRLDKGTSGVFMVARTPAAYDNLVAQLKARTVARTYCAVAWGNPDAREGIIDAPLGRGVRDATRMTVREDGKPARTTYRVLAMWAKPAVCLVSCVLDTGRTHQIRVHLEAIHHPVYGDTRYSGGRQGSAIDRPALHAASLGFRHPATGEWCEFASPLPEDMVAVLDSFGAPEWGSLSDVG